MKENSGVNFEIHSKINDDTSIVVKFQDSSDTMIALDELDNIKSIHEVRQTILRIRNICQTDDGNRFYPKTDVKLPKARWLSVAAAASYSAGIPIDIIVEKSELDRKIVAAYCTSVNNPTSQYLTIIEERVHINSRGVEWLLNLLVKDKQIVDEKV